MPSRFQHPLVKPLVCLTVTHGRIEFDLGDNKHKCLPKQSCVWSCGKSQRCVVRTMPTADLNEMSLVSAPSVQRGVVSRATPTAEVTARTANYKRPFKR